MNPTQAKQWHQRTKPDIRKTESLATQININPVLASLLVSRNIETYDEAKHFFRADLDALHNPFLMADMSLAVKRIIQQKEAAGKILFYGDYDVDGTTAVALMSRFFDSFYPHYEVYVPHRDGEGYGVSKQGVDFAKHTNCSLMVTLDCGIRDHESIEYANSLGVDVIVCDHHTVGESLPPAFAVLNPKRPDCKYPFKELSGCGIGFKLTQALAHELHFEKTIWQDNIDLVAVSTAADMVSMTGENRIFVKAGIEKLIHNPSQGLEALKKVSGLADNNILTVSDIVFRLAPRINAAGRMAHALQAVDLLKANDLENAMPPAETLHHLNTQRQDIEKEMLADIFSFIEEKPEEQEKKSLVVYMEGKPKGILGIVASKLVERYYKPTIVLTDNGDFAVGSARSVSDFDLYAAIDRCNTHLLKFGGHRFAAGLTLPIDTIPAFSECFEKTVRQHITPEQEIAKISYDAELSFEQITPKFVNILNQLCPFGPDNRRPVFMTSHLQVANGSRMVGKENDVMRLLLEDENGNRFLAVGFGMKNLEKTVFKASYVDICYVIEENYFRGNTSLQLRLKDIR